MGTRTRSLVPTSFLKQVSLWALLPIIGLILIAPSVTHAQVPTNITSSGLNTTITQDIDQDIDLSTYNITGGTRPGGGPNLFHSFGNFSVGVGDTANFSNASGLATSNIIGRVTNGNISSIYGTIQTAPEFGSANLFLMNPSGFVFGPTASLNVGGAVSFTTAQYIRLFDGATSTNFYANPSNDGLANSLLVMEPALLLDFLSPAAYGFLTAPDPNATITVQGSELSVPSGQSISLVGGKVVIKGEAQLSAPSGKILLATAASPGEFDVNMLQSLPNVDGTFFTSFGSVNMAPDSSIDVHGSSTVWIKGGQLMLSINDATLSTSGNSALFDTISLGPGSALTTSNSGTDPGADIQLTAGTVRMNGASIQTTNSGDLNGGNISIDATTVDLTGTFISSFTGLDFNTFTLVGSGDGGNVTVQGLRGTGSHAHMLTLSGSGISTQTVGLGHGGDVQLNADTLTMDSSSIETGTSVNDANQGGGGIGGNVVLHARIAELLGSSSISSRTSNFASTGGHGGNLTIQGLQSQGADSAAEQVTLSGGSRLETFNFGDRNGGRIAITSTSLNLDGSGTTINSEVAGLGPGGDVVVSVRSARLSGGARITSKTISSQGGPSITLKGLKEVNWANSVTLAGFDTGIISDSVGGTTRAGDIEVQARTVRLTDGAVIQAGTVATTAAGGNVTIIADSVDLFSGSRISSQASDSDAGQITITANTLALDDSSIATNTLGQGRAGDIALLIAHSMTLRDGSTISSGSTGTGNAGNIVINSKAAPGKSFEMSNSQINTSAALADGGNIEIFFTDRIRLTDSTITSSVGNETIMTTKGGNITIDPDYFIMQRSGIRANAFAGQGGAIDITAGLFLADASSVVDASSTEGVSGTVQINAPINNLSEVISRLPESLIEVQALLRAACAARMAQGGTSSFVERGRDSIPAGPEGLLASPYLPVASKGLARAQTHPSAAMSGLQLRRLSDHASPAPATILLEHATCSS